MDPRTRSWLLRPSTARDPHLSLDRLTSVAVDAGAVSATTAGGRQVSGTLTRVEGGALRLRLGDAPVGDPGALKPELAETPADAQDLEPWLEELTGMRLLGTLLGPGLGTGPLTDSDGRPAGWQIALRLEPEDAVYGGGECFQAIDLRGRLRHCVNLETHGAGGLDASYLTVPFFWTDAGRGVLAVTGAPVQADLGHSHGDVLALTVPDDALDVLLYDGDPTDLLAQHHAATGLPGQIPDWSLGVWTSRCSYFSAAEIERVLDGYERAACPVDVVHVDAWQVGDVIADLSCNWEVDRDRFPTGWGKRLNDRGVHLSLWHNPYLRADTEAGEYALAHGFVLRDADGAPVGTNDMPERLLVDVTHPEAMQWWHGLVHDLLAGEGAASIKGDFAEEVPPSAMGHDGRSGWQLRNAYATAYQQASHRALLDATGDSAAVMFNRSGSAGAHRYPGHWVGDTPATWTGLASAVRGMITLSLSGFGVVASDVGGFWTERRVSPGESAASSWDEASYEADVEPELFVRWTQIGVLSPLLRFHGTGKREPWAYPAQYGIAAVEATRLRPRLAAYLARAAHEAASFGTPMLRPMPLACPRERAARDRMQWFLGPDILVAPVLAPGGRVDVWLPTGEWRGLHGAPDLEGGVHSVQLPLDALPAWVRPGAEPLAKA